MTGAPNPLDALRESLLQMGESMRPLTEFAEGQRQALYPDTTMTITQCRVDDAPLPAVTAPDVFTFKNACGVPVPPPRPVAHYYGPSGNGTSYVEDVRGVRPPELRPWWRRLLGLA